MPRAKTPTFARAIPLIALAALATAATGCASANYLADRRVDALDILTATAGEGYGIRALAGPASVGLLMNMETRGLKGGEALVYEDKGILDFFNLVEMNLALFSLEQFSPTNSESNLKKRHKHYASFGVLGLAVPLKPGHEPWSRGHLYRLTQIEVVGGIVRTGKLGLNPGELLDFILGWTTFDIYDDDLGRTQKTAENETDPAQ